MRLGLMMGYSGPALSIDVSLIQEAESLGFDSVWSAEAWGSDAVSPLAWLAAQTSRIKLGAGVMQLPGRSPANTAMTAQTLDSLSQGRFVLGLGTSGPQVVEGWHGQPFYKPLTWMREYIGIVRTILKREAPLEHDGEIYQIPFRGEHATGQGKPLKSIMHGRADIPLYTGSMAPKSQAMSAELADGCLLVCMDPEQPEILETNFRKGLGRVPGKRREDFDVAPSVAVALGDDLEALRAPLKHQLALYIGGMGSRKTNFYNAYIRKIGFESAAIEIQSLFLEGKKLAAIAAVPNALVDRLYLVGSRERIRDRLAVWKESGVGTLIVSTPSRDVLRLMAELNA